MSDKIMVRAMLCPRCDHVDDLVPDPRTGMSRRCPCPHDGVTYHGRLREVERRHRQAVALARQRAAVRGWYRPAS